jgi:hypothetical protein
MLLLGGSHQLAGLVDYTLVEIAEEMGATNYCQAQKWAMGFIVCAGWVGEVVV